MTDIRSLAIRFADLWSVDHHQMVDAAFSGHRQELVRVIVDADAIASVRLCFDWNRAIHHDVTT